MKILLYIIGAVVLIAVIIFMTGMALPKAHVAKVRAHYKQPPQKLYEAIVDVAHGPSWRTGLKRVEIQEQAPLKWKEEADWGTLTMVLDQSVPPSKVVSRMADTGQGFGGAWTYEIAPEAGGSVVTFTENGEVYSPVFRFISRFIFGHYKSLETYATDLGRHFNETVKPERIR